MKVSLKSAALSTLAVALVGVFGAGCNNDSGGGGGTTAGTTGTTGTTGSTAKVSPGPQEPDKSMIQIGLVASLNGELKPWGDDCQNGALLAVAEANDAGGVDGKKIQLLIEDSASKPEQGKTAAETLASKGVVGLIGEVSSGITAQIANTAKEKGLADVAVGATRIDLAKMNPNFVRVCYTDSFQGPVMAKFAYEQKQLRNVAIITDKKQPYSVGLSASFKDYFEKLGGKIVDQQAYESGQTQFSGILTAVKAKNPDGVFLSGYFPEVGPLIRQAHDAGITDAVFMGGDGWDSSDILNSGGQAILGQYFCNHYNNEEDRPAVKDFLAKWKDRVGGVPATTMGALGYDATKLLIDAIKRAGGPDKAKIITALNDTENFPGVSGTITLKGHKGDPPKRALVVKLDATKNQVFEHAYEPGKDNDPVDASK